jgi:hypothetical protein
MSQTLHSRSGATRHLSSIRTIGVVVLALLVAPTLFAVEASPEKVTIATPSDTITIAVTHNGAPVPAGDIASVKLYVDQHDYDHMITVEKSDGQVIIRPTLDLELGHYDLAIKTRQGEVRVPVTALQGVADEGLEGRAKRQGVTVEEIKAQLGISQAMGQDRITLGFAETCNVGTTVTCDMNVPEGRTAEWTVNGEKVDAPGGKLTYTYEEPGTYDFAYVEKAGGRALAIGLVTVRATERPGQPVEVKVGVEQTLPGPEGYGRYAWKLDGAEAGTSSSWKGSFESPGTHVVTVRADTPVEKTDPPIRIVAYHLTVK